jgi:parvulin-like peptidyl-prolyl isomerase
VFRRYFVEVGFFPKIIQTRILPSQGYIRRGQLAPSFAQFEEAAFSLMKKGDISEVVSTPYGYHIIRLEDMRGTAVRPLNQVKERIRFSFNPKKDKTPILNM